MREKQMNSLFTKLEDCCNNDINRSNFSRRDVLGGLLIASIVATPISEVEALSGKEKEIETIGTKEHPIAIIGGGGRTGMAFSEALVKEGGNGVIMTRTGKDPFQIIKLPTETRERLLSYPKPVDVRKAEDIVDALKNTKPSVVVFAASASKQGGNSFEVDDAGVENVALAAKSVGAKLVLVSALAVDRPDSKSFQITNTIGGYMNKIMDAKISGERKVRSIMGKENYAIIRPGVLLNGKTRNGPSDIELNQGDTIGGGLSRDELAGIIVGCIQSQNWGITVEAYRKGTRTVLEPRFSIPSGKELASSTYVGMFRDAIQDN